MAVTSAAPAEGRFALESLDDIGANGVLSVQDLDGDVAPQEAVGRAVHHTHTATGDRRVNSIVS